MAGEAQPAGRTVKLRLSGEMDDVVSLVVMLKMLPEPGRHTDLRDALARLGISVTVFTDRCSTPRNYSSRKAAWEIVLQVADVPKAEG